jgi:hypothetical protein
METEIAQRWVGRMGLSMAYHRKLWEFIYILRALEVSGCLKPGIRGLGFGVGKEPLAAVMADAGCEIVATDMPAGGPNEETWTTTDQRAARVEDLRKEGICDRETFLQRVTFRPVDMNRIPADLAGFDFAWSSCALDHLGSIPHGLQFVLNSLECLKPGGVAVHTTEFNLSSNTRTLTDGAVVLFRRKDIEELARRLAEAGHEIVLNFRRGTRELDRYLVLPPYTEGPGHLKILLGSFETTSIGVIVRKGVDGRTPEPFIAAR